MIGDKVEVNVKNFKYLDELVHSESEEISLEYDIILDDNEQSDYIKGIEIDEDLIIDGNGHFIDAKNKSRIFEIFADDVVLKNINFKNGFADNGSALLNNSGDVEVVNCQFNGNNARFQGGAIACLSGLFKISSCRFTQNNAQTGGGAIINGDELEIMDTYFEDNTSQLGGTIFNIAKITIYNSKFVNNRAIDGGAIDNFENSSLKISGSEFEKNIAKNGGAIFNFSDLEIENSLYLNNESSDIGGAVVNLKTTRITDSKFDSNISRGIAGAFAHDGSSTIISNTEFIHNQAANMGGAIFCKNFDSRNLKHENCKFVGNSPDDIR